MSGDTFVGLDVHAESFARPTRLRRFKSTGRINSLVMTGYPYPLRNALHSALG